MTADVHDLRHAYGAAASAWASGPAGIYRALAEPLLAACPPLEGARVLDVGAGTGMVGARLAASGAHVVEVDLAAEMLQVDQGDRPPGVVADGGLLPFRTGSFAVITAAFVLSHLPDPVAGLAEMTRVVGRGGAVVATGFDGGWHFEAKATLEGIMASFGFRRPAWYEHFKTEVEPQVASAGRLLAMSHAAGLAPVEVTEVTLDLGVRSATEIVDWRLGMPAYASFLEELGGEQRTSLRSALVAALGPDLQPLVPRLLLMMARVP